MTNTPDVVTHTSVVTRNTECVALIVAASHDLEVKETELLNTYMMTLNKELGDDAGKSAVEVRVSNKCRCIV